MDKIRDILMKYGRQDERNFLFFIISNLNWARYENQIELLTRYIPKNAKVLELGCGLGQAAAMLALRRPDLKIIATDVEEAATWSHLREFGCVFRKCDATDIFFNPEEFDAVFSFGVIEHTQDDTRFLREVGRCLKKGGCNIVFNLPNRYSMPEFVAEKFKVVCHKRKYLKKEIINLFKENGFQISYITREHFVPAQIDRISENLGGIFNRAYKQLLVLDSIICKTPLALFCQDFSLISQKL